MNKDVSRSAGGMPPLALIAGPTASGKSALAVRLAEVLMRRLPSPAQPGRGGAGVIINADASQLYADLRVLSARPSLEEEARVPHRLFGVVDGAHPCSAADWAAMAKVEIAACHARGDLPILVGGTGLYIRTLIDGIAPVPPIDPVIRAEIRAMAVAESHACLAREDPEAAVRLNSNDTTRIARALEVVRSTGRSIRDWQADRSGGIGESVGLAATILLPPRDQLYARADARFEAMLASGAIEEVATLMARGLDPALPVMRAIGVREIAAWLAGETDRERMIADAAAATRRYAKRQYTWFTYQPPPKWPRVTSKLDCELEADNIIKLLYNRLTR